MILGEQSAHAELADLLRHYAAAPVTPYHEFLTVPRRRVRTWPLVSPCSQKNGFIPAIQMGVGFSQAGKIKGKGSPSITKAGVGTGTIPANVQHPSWEQGAKPWAAHPRGDQCQSGSAPDPAPLSSCCRTMSPKYGRRAQPAAMLCVPNRRKHHQTCWCTALS